MKSWMIRAMPRGLRSASSFIGIVCEPSGQSGAMQRNSPASAGTTLRQARWFMKTPCTNSSVGAPSVLEPSSW